MKAKKIFQKVINKKSPSAPSETYKKGGCLKCGGKMKRGGK